MGLWKAILGFEPTTGLPVFDLCLPGDCAPGLASRQGALRGQPAGACARGSGRVFFRHWETGPAQRQAEQEVQACLQALVAAYRSGCSR